MRPSSRARLGIPGVLAVLSCGPEHPLPEAELEEICGVPGPFQLFALEPGEHVSSSGPGIHRVGDRLLFTVGDLASTALLDWIDVPNPRLYATGPCGEDRVLVAEHMVPYPQSPWPEVALGCDERYTDLYTLDLTGVAAPELLLRGGCLAFQTDHGFVRADFVGDSGWSYLLYPYAVDGRPGFAAPVELYYGIDIPPRVVSLHDDDTLLLLEFDELIRVTLPDGAHGIVQTDVFAYAASSDGRFLLWQDRKSLTGDPDQPSGDVYLRDEDTGTVTLVAHARLPTTPTGVRGKWVHIDLDEGDERLVALPSLTTYDLPAPWHTFAEVADGRWLVTSGESASTGPWALRDLATGEQTLVTDRAGTGTVTDDFLDLLAGVAPDDFMGTGELWRYPYDGSQPELVAHRAGRFRRYLGDDRFVTVVDPEADGHGTLILVEDLAEYRIDDRVYAVPLLYPGGDLFTHAYTVEDGDRSGVWLARLKKRR